TTLSGWRTSISPGSVSGQRLPDRLNGGDLLHDLAVRPQFGEVLVQAGGLEHLGSGLPAMSPRDGQTVDDGAPAAVQRSALPLGRDRRASYSGGTGCPLRGWPGRARFGRCLGDHGGGRSEPDRRSIARRGFAGTGTVENGWKTVS